MTELMRWDVINELLLRSTERRYLEIGIDHGECGRRIKSKNKWGVDPASHGASAFEHYYKGTSDSFFQDDAGKFDVVFVDGLHHADQVYRDVMNSVDHLAEGGTVVMHDCNPQSEPAQRTPRQSKVWNGDCWKAMVKLRAHHAELYAFVIDTDEGLGIVTRSGEKRELLSLERDPFWLDWMDLEKDRVRLLGLISVEEWRARQ